jgi:hypothetical protein
MINTDAIPEASGRYEWDHSRSIEGLLTQLWLCTPSNILVGVPKQPQSQS